MNSYRVFLSHQTACLFWVHHDIYETKRVTAKPTSKDVPLTGTLKDARHYVTALGEQDLHVLTHSDNKHRHIAGAKIHSIEAALPHNSFYQVAKGVLVVGPELCFLEAGNFLSLNELILYGFELCGSYARTGTESGSRYKRESLTSTTRIKRYLQNTKGAWGLNAAKRAIRYIANGSASVRESQLVMMLTLPPMLGGYGLPMPLLNHGIEVNRPDPFNPGKNLILHGDIVWPQGRIVVEYDGKQHGLENNHESDKQRDHLLLDAGYKIVRFTNRQISDPIEVQRLARTINRIGKMRRSAASFAPDSRKLEMQHRILYASDPPWILKPAATSIQTG